MKAILLSLIIAASAQAQTPERNLVIITLDGVRWQEVFTGADSALAHDPRFTPGLSRAKEEFWTTPAAERRRKLMPFLWDSLAPRGVLLGDRNAGSRVDITNTHRFSYPGYSELLTGVADDERINSNNKLPNPNVTILEMLNALPRLRGKVAAFASWDVFPFIINEERSGVLVNGGPEPVTGRLTEGERHLNKLLEQLPNPWPGIRHDALTHNFALEYLKRVRPRVLYIAFDETDDFAHGKQYHSYLRAMRRTDDMIRELWQWLESTPGYRGNTNVIITTDHGRGHADRFGDHAKDVDGAQHIWIAMVGPDIKHAGSDAARGQFHQNQIARTAAALMRAASTGDARAGNEITVGRK
jgi:hypothetical protein